MFNSVPLPAAQVISAQFDDSRAPHELVVRFTRDVWESLDHTDLVLINAQSRELFPTERMTINWDFETNTAHFVFVRADGGVLPEGTWHATLLAEGITDAEGNPLDGDADELPGGDHQFQFNYNAADLTHDGVVNLLDFNVLSANFGRTGATHREGDVNYDGRVDLNDFGMLATRFNNEIDGAGHPVGALAQSATSSMSKAVSSPSETIDLSA
jgi:hypothetical protein